MLLFYFYKIQSQNIFQNFNLHPLKVQSESHIVAYLTYLNVPLSAVPDPTLLTCFRTNSIHYHV
jgi:hypothetical protein